MTSYPRGCDDDHDLDRKLDDLDRKLALAEYLIVAALREAFTGQPRETIAVLGCKMLDVVSNAIIELVGQAERSSETPKKRR